MNLVPRMPAHAPETIRVFVRHQVDLSESRGVVLGLSGGIDSAVMARLAADAIGAKKVLGALLPGQDYPPELLHETQAYADSLGIRTRILPIAAIEDAVRALLPEVRDRTTRGNVAARSRMILLYSLAREGRALVVGTGNKSELLTGYFTKYGDGGADILPMGDLYKTQLRELAGQLEIPAAIQKRSPTAGLWAGQTDEGELGLPYADLDRILMGIEQLRSPEEIARITRIPLGKVRAVEARVAASRHKRRTPPIPKLSLRTIGLDWRE
jgi:NAD+ synthase